MAARHASHVSHVSHVSQPRVIVCRLCAWHRLTFSALCWREGEHLRVLGIFFIFLIPILGIFLRREYFMQFFFCCLAFFNFCILFFNCCCNFISLFYFGLFIIFVIIIDLFVYFLLSFLREYFWVFCLRPYYYYYYFFSSFFESECCVACPRSAGREVGKELIKGWKFGGKIKKEKTKTRKKKKKEGTGNHK